MAATMDERDSVWRKSIEDAKIKKLQDQEIKRKKKQEQLEVAIYTQKKIMAERIRGFENRQEMVEQKR